MKYLSLSLLLAGLALAPIAAKADPLTGSTVNGSLYFNVAPNTNRFTPSTAIIGPQLEYSFTAIINSVTYTANFGAFGVTFGITTANNAIAGAYTESFSDSAFVGDILSTTPALNALGLTYGLSGDTLTLTYAGGVATAGTTTSTFLLTSPAATPEPSSLVLLGTGLAGVGVLARRRFVAA